MFEVEVGPRDVSQGFIKRMALKCGGFFCRDGLVKALIEAWRSFYASCEMVTTLFITTAVRKVRAAKNPISRIRVSKRGPAADSSVMLAPL